MRAWRAFIAVNKLLFDRLGRELQEEHGLTHSDYEILVRLSESPGHALRMTELSEQTLLSKSRLSHQITRMEEAGWVRRESCPTDRRGAFAVLTEQGRKLLEEAAPTHVRGVREHLIDRLTREEIQALGEVLDRVRAHLDWHARRGSLERGDSAPAVGR